MRRFNLQSGCGLHVHRTQCGGHPAVRMVQVGRGRPPPATPAVMGVAHLLPKWSPALGCRRWRWRGSLGGRRRPRERVVKTRACLSLAQGPLLAGVASAASQLPRVVPLPRDPPLPLRIVLLLNWDHRIPGFPLRWLLRRAPLANEAQCPPPRVPLPLQPVCPVDLALPLDWRRMIPGSPLRWILLRVPLADEAHCLPLRVPLPLHPVQPLGLGLLLLLRLRSRRWRPDPCRLRRSRSGLDRGGVGPALVASEAGLHAGVVQLPLHPALPLERTLAVYHRRASAPWEPRGSCGGGGGGGGCAAHPRRWPLLPPVANCGSGPPHRSVLRHVLLRLLLLPALAHLLLVLCGGCRELFEAPSDALLHVAALHCRRTLAHAPAVGAEHGVLLPERSPRHQAWHRGGRRRPATTRAGGVRAICLRCAPVGGLLPSCLLRGCLRHGGLRHGRPPPGTPTCVPQRRATPTRSGSGCNHSRGLLAGHETPLPGLGLVRSRV
mmetsp:Transcript_93314/g.291933  ORF Transcript_93314/g.291933 Transcript_93314/m.291933 type:complete len:493 (+) Transcript_93314:118-1596(+)